MKYRLLNIFYNRESEIEILKNMAREEDEQIKENDRKKIQRNASTNFSTSKSWSADTKPKTWNKCTILKL